ncbi:DUF4252 domain-containing protein [Fulvivirga sp. RKSG066]|uniref:DUF4252 domain-containing protein n=1 Tax=Fulvivirga aurantia TaxID=2529383 RepID=UPI0012BC260E|nr:DUF4252 domain-containing protein [Fulvivirga aurantia]MTI20176.1 DUF4252 domain-containing protein [Fulvivirga aurantia]
MKKLATVLFAVIVSSGAALAQSKTVEEFHNKYKDDRDAKVVNLNGRLFDLFSSIASWDESDEEAQAIARIAANIKSMQILSIPLYKSGFSDEDIAKMRKDLSKEKYEELMTVRDGSDKIYFMTQGDEKTIRNMLVLIQEEEEFAVFNINGVLDTKDLSYLAKNHDKWH